MTGNEKIAKRNIVNAFNYIVGGWYNSIVDGYEEYVPDNKEDAINEVYESAIQNLYGPGYEGFNKAPKEMRFAGKEFCMNLINELFNSDEDVIEIAEEKGWN